MVALEGAVEQVRREDIPALAAHLLERALRAHGAPARCAEALRLLEPHLQGYGWPGNVREMENVLERVAVLYGDAAFDASIGAADLRAIVPELFVGDASTDAPARLVSMRRRDERRHIERVLRECGGNQSEAARRLGIGRTTLWRKLSGHGAS